MDRDVLTDNSRLPTSTRALPVPSYPWNNSAGERRFLCGPPRETEAARTAGVATDSVLDIRDLSYVKCQKVTFAEEGKRDEDRKLYRDADSVRQCLRILSRHLLAFRSKKFFPGNVRPREERKDD